MRAIVVDKTAPGGLVLRDVDVPSPAPTEALVRVAAISLNRGEVRMALGMAPAGWRPGWDFAGTVERAAANGDGPVAGTRVVGMLPAGSWAQFVAAPTPVLAALPDAVTFAQGAALPVGGLTALHALARGEQAPGRRVLIAGASGGVGTFAVQLARIAGAQVVAAIRDPKHEILVRRLGADAVAIGADLAGAAAHGPYALILESVGGDSLATALTLLAPGGVCVLFGASESARTTFDGARFRVGGTSLYGLVLGHELQREPPGVGLARLASLVADGALRPEIAAEAPWTDIADIAAQLMLRQFTGKAVLTL